MIFPRIGGRQPVFNVLLELITCRAVSTSTLSTLGNNERFELFVLIASCCMITGTQSGLALPVHSY